MTKKDYWAECIAEAAAECGAVLTSEQESHIAACVEGAHDNYGMAFYSPPPSDRIADVEREWKQKLAAMEARMDRYRTNAEEAVRKALRQPYDTRIAIGEHGEVHRVDGRMERIQ